MKPTSKRSEVNLSKSVSSPSTMVVQLMKDELLHERLLMLSRPRFFNARVAMLASCLILSVASASAQDAVDRRTRALDESRSQGERQAEETVALSAEKLIALLQKETGLLLEVKKLLVRKAFEQGRILESKDLTDEAFFRLLREDEIIRVIATQELLKRRYIQVLPLPEERLHSIRTMKDEADSTPGTPPKPRSTSQEERYWATHEQRGKENNENNENNENLQPTQPSDNPAAPQATPRIPAQPEIDTRRAVQQAQMQDSDEIDSMGGESGSIGSMERISPEDLPELIRARSEQRTTPGMGGSNLPTEPDTSRMSAYPPLTQQDGSGDSMGGNQAQRSGQRASLEAGRMPPAVLPLPRADHAMLRHRTNPYADVPSLYDLYSQYGRRSPTLVRFGDDIFRNGTGNSDQLPMDLPVGPDYVLGPGDGVNINLWGGVSERLRRVVDHEGRISLPEAGFVQVSGRSLGDVQRLVQTSLRSQFRDVQADVSLARLRTVRVYVVGDVERAGAYDISSLSSPLNAVFVAGGPTARGVVAHLASLSRKQVDPGSGRLRSTPARSSNRNRALAVGRHCAGSTSGRRNHRRRNGPPPRDL